MNTEELSNDNIKQLTELWELEAQNLTWTKKWKQVLDTSQYPFTKWFVGGELNACYNALDRHVLSGNGDKVAMIYDSPVTNTIQKLTYKYFLTQVELFAGGLHERFRIRKGDKVLIYVPNVPEGIIAILACCRLGAIHTAALAGLGPKALAARIENFKPRIIVTISATADSNGIHRYKETVDQALKICIHKVENCIVVQRQHFELSELDQNRDVSWEEVMKGASPFKLCTPVKSTDPMFILHTSGTTGEPKGIVFSTGGFCAGISHYAKYPTLDSDVVYVGSQLGWIAAHMITVFATFIRGKSSILYEGDNSTPSFGGIFRVWAEHGVQVIIMNLAYMREIRIKDPLGLCVQQYKFPKLRMLLTGGEPIEEETRTWGEKYLHVPVKSLWGQTELGSPIMKFNCIEDILPITCVGFPAEGITLCIVDDDGCKLPNGEIGNIMAKYPLNPAAVSTIYNNDELFVSTYFSRLKNYYETKDVGKIDNEGRLHVLGRNDSIAFVDGKWLPLLTIEEAIRCHPQVAECSVATTKHYKFGEVPIAFYTAVNKDTRMEANNISNEIYSLVEEKLEEETLFHSSYCVTNLPKSAVGKICRNVLIEFVKDHFPAIEDDITNMTAIFQDIIDAKYNV